MRVAHVVQGLDMGGLEKMLLDFAKFHDRGRFELRFFSIAGRGVVADLLEAEGYGIGAVDKPPGLRPTAIPRLAGMLRRAAVDVVHTHNDNALFYGVPAARLAGVRRIIHTRHLFEPRSRALGYAIGAATRLIGTIACVSADTARVALRHGEPANKLRVVLNGIDFGRHPPRYGDPAGPIVTVGRLSEQKDIATLLRALAIAKTKGSIVRSEILGDGPLRGDLEALARNLGIADQVAFRGVVNTVPDVLAGSSLFVLPSIDEGLSLAIMEAMATGLPVLTTAVGGNPEVVADGETGRLVPARDPQALADAMLAMLADPAALAAMGRAGRQRIERHFDVARTVADYERLYRGEPAGQAVSAGGPRA